MHLIDFHSEHEYLITKILEYGPWLTRYVSGLYVIEYNKGRRPAGG